MIVLDTDHISVLQRVDSPSAERCRQRLRSHLSDDVVTTAVTVEEQTRSWLGLIRRYREVRQQVPYYQRLVDLVRFFPDGTSSRSTSGRQCVSKTCGGSVSASARWT